MSVPSQTYRLYDVIEGTADITNKNYGNQTITRFDIINLGSSEIVVSLGSLPDKTIPAGQSWGYFVDIDSFSVVANSNEYSIDIGV